MTQTSELSTIITANNKQFLQSISQAGLAAKEFSTTAIANFSRLNGIFAGITAAGGLTIALKEGYQSLDKLNASAERLGTSSASFQFLEYAAKRSNVEIETLEGGLRKLSLSIVKGLNGDSTKQSAFKELGIDLQKIKNLNIDQQFEIISTALNKLSRPDQIRLGTEIMSRNFQALFQIVHANLGEFRKNFNDLGGAVDTKGFDELDIKIKNIDERWTQFKRRLTLNVVGPTLDYFDKLAEKIAKMEAPRLVAKAQNASADVFTQLASMSTINGNLPNLPSNILQQFGNSIDKLTSFLDPYKQSKDSSANAAVSAAASLTRLTDASGIAAEALRGIGEGTALNKLKSLLNLSPESGADYLKNNTAAGPKQYTDDYIKQLLADFQANIMADPYGTNADKGFGSRLNNESILSSLQNYSNSLNGSGENTQGLNSAIKELTDTYKKVNTNPQQQVVIELKYDENGVVKLFSNSPLVKQAMNNTIAAYASLEAQSTVANGG